MIDGRHAGHVRVVYGVLEPDYWSAGHRGYCFEIATFQNHQRIEPGICKTTNISSLVGE